MMRKLVYRLQASRSPVQRLHAAVIQSPAVTRALFGVTVTPTDTDGYFDLTTVVMQSLLRRRLRGRPDARCLEIGVGGFAVLSGSLSRHLRHPIDACDIDGERVERARRHAAANGLAVNVFQSDLFAAVPRTDYDLIFWNLPYWDDPDRYLPGLFSAAPDHLAPGGELAIGYNAHRLPRAAVLDRLEREPRLALRDVATWWWNLHEVVIAARV